MSAPTIVGLRAALENLAYEADNIGGHTGDQLEEAHDILAWLAADYLKLERLEAETSAATEASIAEQALPPDKEKESCNSE